MAITIRNKALEAEIRAIGKATGKGPTDVLRAMLDAHRKAEEAERRAVVQRRARALQGLIEEARARSTDDDRATVKQSLAELYDADGAPK